MYSKTFNKISLALFGFATKKIKASGLQDTLTALNEKTSAQQFIASSLFSSLIAFFVFLTVFIIASAFTLELELSQLTILFNILVALIATGILFAMFYEMPFMQYSNKKHEMRKELAKETIHLALIGKHLKSLKDFFVIITRFEETPELKKFSENVLKQSEKTNMDFALKQELEKISSKRVKNFFSSLQALIKSKATAAKIKHLIENELEKGKEESEIQRERNLGEALLLIQAIVVITVLAIILIILTFTNKVLGMQMLSNIIYFALPAILAVLIIVIELNTERID